MIDFLDGSGPHTADDHAQPGDPTEAAKVIVDVASAGQPVLRIRLGAVTVQRAEPELRFVQQEPVTWRAFALSTDHDDVAAR
jgi:hypothetical protein